MTADRTRVDAQRPIAPDDWTPSSLLTRRPLEPEAVAVGLLGMGSVALVGAALVAWAWWLSFVVVPAQRAEARENDPKPELAVVETKFVKLGRERDPRKLPNRRVPQRSTAPERVETGVSRERTRPPDVDAGPPPPDPMEDLLTRLGTRADALAKLSDRAYDQEGDEEGVEDGTETRETGSLYAGRLRNFFRRGFVAPTNIPDDELRTLRVRVRIEITMDGRLGAWTVERVSGNADYDEAVQRRMRQADGANLPEVPADEAERFLGHATTIDFVGPN